MTKEEATLTAQEIMDGLDGFGFSSHVYERDHDDWNYHVKSDSSISIRKRVFRGGNYYACHPEMESFYVGKTPVESIDNLLSAMQTLVDIYQSILSYNAR